MTVVVSSCRRCGDQPDGSFDRALAPRRTVVTAAFGLGRSSDSAPSAIFVADGELLFGEAAERRGLAQPERLIREFKRRIGDDVPIIAGDQRFAPEELYARMVAWVVDAVAEREGGRRPRSRVAVPVTWGGHRSGLVVRRARARDLRATCELITEPEAAARHYEADVAARARACPRRLRPGRRHVRCRHPAQGRRRRGARRRRAARHRRLRRRGLRRHRPAARDRGRGSVRSRTRGRPRRARRHSRRCAASASRRRRRSRSTPKPSFRVLVGQVHSTVRLTRSEFEEMIEDGVERTIDVLATALETAGVDTDGARRDPAHGRLVAHPAHRQLLSERFDRPIADRRRSEGDRRPRRRAGDGRPSCRACRRPWPSRARRRRSRSRPARTRRMPTPRFWTPPAPPPPSLVADGSSASPRRLRWPVAPWFIATGIVLASATGLGSSPVSNADATSQSLSEWLGVTLFDTPSASADQPATATVEAPAPPAPPESIQREDYSPPSATAKSTPKASNPRSESMQNATQASAAPQAPANTAGGSTGDTTPTTSTNPTGDSTNPTRRLERTRRAARRTPRRRRPRRLPHPKRPRLPRARRDHAAHPRRKRPRPPPAPEETDPAPRAGGRPTPPPAPEETTPPAAPDPSPSPTDPV